MSIGPISNHSTNNVIASANSVNKNDNNTPPKKSNPEVTTNIVTKNSSSSSNMQSNFNPFDPFNPFITNNSGASMLPVITMLSGTLNTDANSIESVLTGLELDVKVLDILIKDSKEIHEENQNAKEHIAAQRSSAAELLSQIMGELYKHKIQHDKVDDKLQSPLV